MTDQLDRTQSFEHRESLPTLKAGDLVAENYVVKSVLGRGGMSVVYLVEQRLLARDYALKVLDVHNQSEQAVRRFKQEAKTASLLKHPNLVAVHDYGLLNADEPYLIMDYITGPTLGEVLSTRGSMAVPDVVALTSQIAFGLIYAHEQGIVHRDIKPGNIMLLRPRERAQEGTVKIVDFGIAKLIQSEDGGAQGLTKTGEIFGSPIYMSPEQCRGGSVDQRSDIYSLGCVVYECLTGSPPFVGDTAMSTMVMRLTQDPKSLRDATSGFEFSPLLESIVRKMLMVEPSDRYQTVSDLVSDLMQLQHGDVEVQKLAANTKVVKNKVVKKAKAQVAEPVKQSSLVRRGMIIAVAALLSMVATAIIDRIFVHEQTPSPVVASDKNVKSDISAPFNPPICKPTASGFVVTFRSNCGTLLIPRSNNKALEIKAENTSVPLLNGQLVSIILDEVAGSSASTLTALSPLSFDLVRFHNRYLVRNDAIKALGLVHHVNEVDVEGCDSVSNLEGIYDVTLKTLKTMGSRVSSGELLKIKCLNQLHCLGFGPVKDPGSVLKVLAEKHVVTDLCYRGPTNPDEAELGDDLSLDDVELICNQLPNLRIVIIWHRKMDLKCLKQFTHLKHLEGLTLKDCGVGPDAIPILKEMHLGYLKLTETGWSAAQQAEVREFIGNADFDKPALEHKELQQERNNQRINSLGISDIYKKDE